MAWLEYASSPYRTNGSSGTVLGYLILQFSDNVNDDWAEARLIVRQDVGNVSAYLRGIWVADQACGDTQVSLAQGNIKEVCYKWGIPRGTTVSAGGTFAINGYTVNHNISARIPGQACTPPYGLWTGTPTSTHNTISCPISIGGWGNGEGNRYIELTASNSPSDCCSTRRWAVSPNTSATITINNSSPGNLDIAPSTNYYIWAYANNGCEDTEVVYQNKSIATKPYPGMPMLTGKASSISGLWSVPQGNVSQTTRLEYKIAGTATWTLMPNITAAATNTQTITGLIPGAKYDVRSAATNVSGTSYSEEISIYTEPEVMLIYPDGTTEFAEMTAVTASNVTQLTLGGII